MYQLGWFSTSRGKTSKALLQAVMSSIKLGEIDAEIAFVFCNREAGEGENSDRFFELVESCNIPLVRLSSKRFKAGHSARFPGTQDNLPAWRREYDRAVMKRCVRREDGHESFRGQLCVQVLSGLDDVP